MPRPPRLFVPDGIYHLAAHGSDRRALFLCDRDRELFLERPALVCERFELALIAGAAGSRLVFGRASLERAGCRRQHDPERWRLIAQ
jgi:hypothetical protein